MKLKQAVCIVLGVAGMSIVTDPVFAIGLVLVLFGLRND